MLHYAESISQIRRIMALTKGEATKERIIDVATHLFVTQGFHATSTRQITDSLKLTRGSIYNHFPGKEQIFEASLYKYHPWLHIPPAVKGASGDSIDELVRNASERMLNAWRKNPELIRLHMIELVEFQGKHLPKLFDDVFEKMTQVVRELVQEREELTSIPIATLSQALLGLFFAHLVTDQLSGIPQRADFDQDFFEYFTDAYLQGVISKELNLPGKD